jgi:uncharacterized protein with ParB-like and HNH nuclease domain
LKSRHVQFKVKDLLGLKHKVVLQPPYQREHVWDKEDDSLLIDTLERGWTIPRIYVNLTKSGIYEVVDGQQRLTAIFSYTSGGFKLTDVARHKGKKFDELPREVQDRILEYQLEALLVEEASMDELVGLGKGRRVMKWVRPPPSFSARK